MLFKKRRGGGRRREGGSRGKRRCHRLGKFKVIARSAAAGSRSGDRGRNFAATRPCVCARGSVSECARVARRARERAGAGAGAGRGRAGEKGEAGVREGTRAPVSRGEEAPGARPPAAAAAAALAPPRPAARPPALPRA